MVTLARGRSLQRSSYGLSIDLVQPDDNSLHPRVLLYSPTPKPSNILLQPPSPTTPNVLASEPCTGNHQENTLHPRKLMSVPEMSDLPLPSEQGTTSRF